LHAESRGVAKILRGLVEFSEMQAVTSLQQLHPDDSLVRQAGTQAAAKRLSAEITLSLDGCKEISARERWKIRAVQPVSRGLDFDGFGGDYVHCFCPEAGSKTGRHVRRCDSPNSAPFFEATKRLFKRLFIRNDQVPNLGS